MPQSNDEACRAGEKWGQRGTVSPWGWCQAWSVGMVVVTETVLTMMVAIHIHEMLYHLQSHRCIFSSRTRGLICNNVGNTKLGGRKPYILSLLSYNMQNHVLASKFTLFSWGKYTNICIRFECLGFRGIQWQCKWHLPSVTSHWRRGKNHMFL